MSQAYLSLGSNFGNRFEFIKTAVESIHIRLGTILHISDIYETESWSYNDNDYLNCVIEINTELMPIKLLKESQNIEKKLGRTTKTTINDGKSEYLARSIDIDILFYSDEIVNTQNLVIPHPQLHLRKFVLKPMLQIAPDYIHPVFQEKIETLYIRCKDESRVKLFSACP